LKIKISDIFLVMFVIVANDNLNKIPGGKNLKIFHMTNLRR